MDWRSCVAAVEGCVRRSDQLPSVTVCVCTYRRNDLLGHLLESLAGQSYPLDRMEVVVVDNDSSGAARDVVTQAQMAHPSFRVRYAIEAHQGISYARNHTVALARGELLAFIDDDEAPSPGWLRSMTDTLRKGGFAAVLGPVIPIYPAGTPEWVIRTGFFERARFSTGTEVSTDNGRTSNALVIAARAKARLPHVFEPRFSRSGGEDHDFFKWLVEQGGRLGWCDEGHVEEVVPPQRQTVAFMLERALRTSTVYWRERYSAYSMSSRLREALKGTAGAAAFALLGLAWVVLRKDRAVKYWSSSAKGAGRLLALTKMRLEGY